MLAIGNTPLLKLEKLSGHGMAEIYVKYEATNPTGSMKDRMALAMVEGAERRGQLKAGGIVVEYTGGSTGSSLAMVCAVKGYRAQLYAATHLPRRNCRPSVAGRSVRNILAS